MNYFRHSSDPSEQVGSQNDARINQLLSADKDNVFF